MSAKIARLMVICMGTALMLGYLAGIQGTWRVHAQSSSTPGSCITCHENRYTLYDTGKWYCVSQAQDRCANCHAGDTSSMDANVAHTGLITNPFADGGERCQSCHTQDSVARIEVVIAATGYHERPKVEAYPVLASASAAMPIAWPISNEPQPAVWLVPVAIVLFIFWSWLVIRTSQL